MPDCLCLGGLCCPTQGTRLRPLRPDAQPQGKPPALVDAPLLPPQPRPGRKQAEVYSVSVHNVAIRDLLFALARDARLNLDVHPDLAGTVSINAIDQTINEILDRAAMQVDMRYEMEGRNLFVMPDSPVLRHYRVDYPNVAREARSSVSASSSIGSGGGNSGGSGTGNSSSSSLANTSNNRFWETLTQNIRDLLRETDKLLPEGADAASGGRTAVAGAAVNPVAAAVGATGNPSAAPLTPNSVSPRFREAASVIANPETGVISVRASFRQHLRIREFMDRVMLSAGRQVMIEATIVEVNLSDQYQQGINWTVFRRGLPMFQLGPAGGDMPSGVPMSGVIPSMASFTPTFASAGGLTQISAAVRLLESFGNAKVLSSPKISALNNQAALLKVTEDIVYFTLTADVVSNGQELSATRLTVTSTPKTVSVGLVMSVMPQVGEGDQVTLILRPTLSRVVSYVNDPAVSINLAMARASGADVPEVISKVPQIQTRELESVIKVRSGDTAVLGGLMRENFASNTDQTPGLGNVPGLGELFKYKNRDNAKSELVIFLRPTVVTDASLGGDHQAFEPHLSEALRAMPDQAPYPPGSLQAPRRQP